MSARIAAKLILPLPPSVNRYYRSAAVKLRETGKHRSVTYLSKEGREFLEVAREACRDQGAPRLGQASVAVRLDVHLTPHGGDHHNREKPVLDALEGADVFENDVQVVDLRVVRCHLVPGGRCFVTIWKL